ncbi:cAMP-dependent protein kinase type I-alpha regulatory subunit [Paramecium bursaria]
MSTLSWNPSNGQCGILFSIKFQVDRCINWMNQFGLLIEQQLHQVKTDSNVTSSETDEEDTDEEENIINPHGIRMDRSSVSAEVYGIYNKKANFKPKIVAKSPQQIQKIKDRLLQQFMFASLDEHELRIVINAMEVIQVAKGTQIIKQGDDGDNLYVVDQGQLDCSKLKNGIQQFLKTYQPGESFGELALLYNAPRAATIIANVDCVLFQLDRLTFNHIVKDAAFQKRGRYEEFLARVDILQELDPYSRLQIADALRSKSYHPGDYIVKEGDEGSCFYLLEQGEAIATKILNQSQPPQVVYQYKAGDYFGEIALLRNSPRAASVIAQSAVTVVYLNRNSFKRLLGPLENILTKNFKKYEKYIS